MMEAEEICKKCCSRLREKTRLLGNYNETTAKIKEALESKDILGLDRRLKARQGLIDKIEQIDKEIDTLTRGNGFSIERLSDKSKDLFRGYFDQMRTVLEPLSGLDRDCLDLAQAEYDGMKSEILKVRQGLRVARGYRPRLHQSPRFLDVKR
ncbi:MAG: hypothetical protein JRJ42_00400 [Deltaproteobacteria bacterium]|nr:hypothetical protein [Deltaproteobacteria bacterium]MBW2018930.1 hypothetical protein [Deltaproteobacteria bacterium]MBW2073145.1 hypothetical protein [Deltaproteobacteria bacterium]RLB83764.1 MAG: hypothetical protein DRH17_01000 [Deltaproteobacteria bacterium]